MKEFSKSAQEGNSEFTLEIFLQSQTKMTLNCDPLIYDVPNITEYVLMNLGERCHPVSFFGIVIKKINSFILKKEKRGDITTHAALRHGLVECTRKCV